MDTTTPTGALGIAKDATDWLQYAGGWAMFVVACVVIYFLVKHILSLNAKLDAKDTAHDARIIEIQKECKAETEELQEKIFTLLDKTNELMKAFQATSPPR